MPKINTLNVNSTLNALRKKIDNVDDQLLNLIHNRLKLVNEVGKYKSANGLALHDPAREAAIIARQRDKAALKGISPDFFEDLLKLLITESYANELDEGYPQVNPGLGKVIIIGGKGKMGRLFHNQFRLSGYTVAVLDVGDSFENENLLSSAGLVLITVPILNTVELINTLPLLPAHCILADLTSIKSAPLAAMLKAHQGPVIGLHPMFGPSVKTFVKQLIVRCDGRFPEQYEWLIEQFKIWGCRVETCTAKEHDQAMAYIQALRHFITFVYGKFLESEHANLELLIKFSSPIYRLELGLVGRMFSQSPELYADIILASQYNIDLIKKHFATFSTELNELTPEKREHFLEQFRAISHYFGKYANLFQSETDFLLEK